MRGLKGETGLIGRQGKTIKRTSKYQLKNELIIMHRIDYGNHSFGLNQNLICYFSIFSGNDGPMGPIGLQVYSRV